MSNNSNNKISKRDQLYTKTEGVTTRLVLLMNWFLGLIYFRILNHVTISNKKGIPKERGIFYLSNHFTMVDSWLIGMCFSSYDALFRPWVIPHNVPEKTNFYKGKFTSWWFDHSKCIPILRDAGGKDTHPKVIKALKRSSVLIFPSSTRQRRNAEVKNSPSLGRLIANSGAKKIIPINLKGLPHKGGFFPIFFKKVEIIIGDPIEMEDLGSAETKEQCVQIVKNIRDIIEKL